MPAALGPRFVLEAGFLILLAVVVGLADLSPALIILVMAVGWLLVALIEYFAWRQSPTVSLVRVGGTVAEGAPPEPVAEGAPPEAAAEEVVEEAPPPAPAAPPPPVEEETVVAPRAEAQAEPEPSESTETIAFHQQEEARARHRLEPLKPRPRRRWILFGPRDRSPEGS